MKTTIENNELVIRIPMQSPRPSSTGKTLVVATTGGGKETPAMFNDAQHKDKPIVVSVNAYFKP